MIQVEENFPKRGFVLTIQKENSCSEQSKECHSFWKIKKKEQQEEASFFLERCHDPHFLFKNCKGSGMNAKYLFFQKLHKDANELKEIDENNWKPCNSKYSDSIRDTSAFVSENKVYIKHKMIVRPLEIKYSPPLPSIGLPIRGQEEFSEEVKCDAGSNGHDSNICPYLYFELDINPNFLTADSHNVLLTLPFQETTNFWTVVHDLNLFEERFFLKRCVKPECGTSSKSIPFVKINFVNIPDFQNKAIELKRCSYLEAEVFLCFHDKKLFLIKKFPPPLEFFKIEISELGPAQNGSTEINTTSAYGSIFQRATDGCGKFEDFERKERKLEFKGIKNNQKRYFEVFQILNGGDCLLCIQWSKKDGICRGKAVLKHGFFGAKVAQLLIDRTEKTLTIQIESLPSSFSSEEKRESLDPLIVEFESVEQAERIQQNMKAQFLFCKVAPIFKKILQQEKDEARHLQQEKDEALLQTFLKLDVERSFNPLTYVIEKIKEKLSKMTEEKAKDVMKAIKAYGCEFDYYLTCRTEEDVNNQLENHRREHWETWDAEWSCETDLPFEKTIDDNEYDQLSKSYLSIAHEHLMNVSVKLPQFCRVYHGLVGYRSTFSNPYRYLSTTINLGTAYSFATNETLIEEVSLEERSDLAVILDLFLPEGTKCFSTSLCFCVQDEEEITVVSDEEIQVKVFYEKKQLISNYIFPNLGVRDFYLVPSVLKI